MTNLKNTQKIENLTSRFHEYEKVKEFHKFMKKSKDCGAYVKAKRYYENVMQESGKELEESLLIECAEAFKELNREDAVNYIAIEFDNFIEKFEGEYGYFIDYEFMTLGNICDFDYNEEHKYVVLNKAITSYLSKNYIKIDIYLQDSLQKFIKKSFDNDLNSKYDINFLKQEAITIIDNYVNK